jgi:hypothetical protein
MKTLTLIIGLSVTCIVQGQTNTHPSEGTIIESSTLAKKGTFQLVFESEQIAPVSLDAALLNLIETKRNESREVYFEHQPGVIVRILPKTVISATSFTPLNEEAIVSKKVYQDSKNQL